MPGGAVTVSVSTWGLPETSLTFDFEEFVKNELGLDLRGDNKKNSESGICKFYLRGGCSKGNSCPYQHSRGDRAVVCKHWLRGLCKKGDMCEFLHEYNLKKMPECWFYSKYGDCSNGDECLYLHIDPESKIRECPWYARGFCKQGPECRHKHVRKVVCQLYLTGFCPHGPTCSNGHPKWELAEAEEEEEISRQQPRRNISDIVCFKCGQKGHYANRCPNV